MPTLNLSRRSIFAAIALALAALVLAFSCGSVAKPSEAPPSAVAEPAAVGAGETEAIAEEESYGDAEPVVLPLYEKPAGWTSPFERHGRLSVKGTKLVDAAGKPVQLKGLSSSNLAAFDQFVTEDAIAELAYAWNVDVLRLAVYTYAIHGGYYASPRIGDVAIEAAKTCAKYGIYAIVDWHILVDGNPLETLDGALEYFDKATTELGDAPNVIYEICNEPNRPEVTWKDSIKPYAEKVIPAIRKKAPSSVVIVGTPTWSQDVDIAAESPLSFPNTMYTLHFYAGSHGQDLRDRAAKAMKKVAVFCTEWGTSIADGGRDMVVYEEETAEWLALLDANSVSWCNWQLCDMAGEASSIIDSGLPWEGKRLYERLSPSGALIRSILLKGGPR